MPTHHDVSTPDGRQLRVHDSGGPATPRLTLLWQTGSPQTGALLDPLLAAATAREIRLLSYGRPSYGSSTPTLAGPWPVPPCCRHW